MTKRQKLLIGASLLVLVLVSAISVHLAQAKGSEKTVDFSLTNIEGKTVKLSDYRGKVVVIDVWTTWCHYCVEEIPALKEIQAAATKAKTPLQIIGVAMDDPADVQAFAKVQAITYPVVYGTEKAIKPFGKIYGYPTKFIVNDQGVVVDKIIGALAKEALLKRIEKHLPAK